MQLYRHIDMNVCVCVCVCCNKTTKILLAHVPPVFYYSMFRCDSMLNAVIILDFNKINLSMHLLSFVMNLNVVSKLR